MAKQKQQKKTTGNPTQMPTPTPVLTTPAATPNEQAQKDTETTSIDFLQKLEQQPDFIVEKTTPKNRFFYSFIVFLVALLSTMVGALIIVLIVLYL